LTGDVDRLCAALGHQFADTSLLREALTHRSLGAGNNERLEFLGDSVLGLVIAQQLFVQFPRASEGALSRLRASLVNGEALAGLARQLSLGDYLHLGGGELKSGGVRRASILADALEAVFGAIYVDGGFERCRSCILNLYHERLAALSTSTPDKDSKTRLQEFLQARKKMLPSYELRSVEGEGHAQTFVVDCHIDGLSQAVVGSGSSRRRAEQEAASQALQVLDHG
jgi:ribonuclease-3